MVFLFCHPARSSKLLPKNFTSGKRFEISTSSLALHVADITALFRLGGGGPDV
jgi:hypothetical protein